MCLFRFWFPWCVCPEVIVTYIFTTMLPYSFVTMIQVSWGNWRSLKLLKKEGRVVCFQNLSSSCVYGQIRGNMWEKLELLLESLHFSIKKPQKSCHSLLAWRVSIERSAVILMGIPLCVICCFSLDILKVMKENNLQPRLLYPARISFKYEGEIKSFTNKQKLREFSTTKPALQQMLKDIL